jgi:hypothetical protein
MAVAPAAAGVGCHVTMLAGLRLDEAEDVFRLRRNVNNILDWGLLSRREEIKADLKALRERLARGERALGVSSPKKRQRIV